MDELHRQMIDRQNQVVKEDQADSKRICDKLNQQMQPLREQYLELKEEEQKEKDKADQKENRDSKNTIKEVMNEKRADSRPPKKKQKLGISKV